MKKGRQTQTYILEKTRCIGYNSSTTGASLGLDPEHRKNRVSVQCYHPLLICMGGKCLYYCFSCYSRMLQELMDLMILLLMSRVYPDDCLNCQWLKAGSLQRLFQKKKYFFNTTISTTPQMAWLWPHWLGHLWSG